MPLKPGSLWRRRVKIVAGDTHRVMKKKGEGISGGQNELLGRVEEMVKLVQQWGGDALVGEGCLSGQ